MAPVLVWGGGAIGGTLAAVWAKAGVDVLMVDIAADHVAASQKGLAITGPVTTLTVPVPSVTPAALSGVYERIVLAVKAPATAAAAEALAPHLAPDGFVLSAQNGLNELMLAERFGQERVMGAFVNFGADWHGPGDILYGNRGAVVVGEIDGVIRPRTKDMHALLKLFEPDAVLTDDIFGYLWGKLGYGAMLFATALTPQSMHENFADPGRVQTFVALGREVMAVAAARGVSPRGFNGFDPAAFWPGADEAAARASIAALADFTSRTAKTHTGIWRDLAVRKRRTEVREQVGLVATLGAEAGVPCPMLSRLTALIIEIEDGRRPQAPETFEALAECG
ncbi:MAG: 2-dehydropantoate 2-reductase N-terminal domain-containing protein [Pseudomonadota bacterium]